VTYAERRGFWIALPEAERMRISSDTHLLLWGRTERATAQTRGDGVPVPRWGYNGNVLRHNEGHRDDCLYLNIPLRGDFQVSSEVQGLRREPGAPDLRRRHGGDYLRLEVVQRHVHGSQPTSEDRVRRVVYEGAWLRELPRDLGISPRAVGPKAAAAAR
jgi:hypothetical protein